MGLGAVHQEDGVASEEEAIDPKRPFPQSELAERPISPVVRPRPVQPSTHRIGGL